MFKSDFMRYGFLLIGWLLCYSFIQAQNIAEPDSLTIDQKQSLKAVDIVTFRIRKENPFDLKTNLGKEKLDLLPTVSVNQLLAQQSTVYIKQYGAGGLSTPALRGASASQTAVLWNGFNLQSSMNGTFDLNLLPVFFIDDFSIDYNASSALWGSGAIGGAFQLNNSNQYKQGFSVKGGVFLGSFENNTQQIGISYSGKKWMTRTRLFRNKTENNFPFINHTFNEKPVHHQTNADFSQLGILHENAFKIGRHHELDIKIWWQNNERGLPPTMHQSNATARQEDKALRNILSWNYKKGKWESTLRAAYFNEDINYSDSMSFIFSEGNTQTFINEYELSYDWNEQNKINVGVNHSQFLAHSASYNQQPQQMRNALYAQYHWYSKDRNLVIGANLRQEMIDEEVIQPIPEINVLYKVLPAVSLKGKTGLSFRYPTFNDLYWLPGGNPNLLPENGIHYGGDIHININDLFKFSNPTFSKLELTVSGFYRDVNDWILWQPTNAGFWSAQNVKRVISRGVETNFKAEKTWRKNVFGLDLQTSYVLSTDEHTDSPNKGLQLFYTPMYTGASNLYWRNKNISFNINSNYTGYVYTSSDHSQFLNPFLLVNTQVNYQVFLNKYTVNIHAAANNILNTDYQVMAWRAMPGRNFLMGVSFLIDNG